MWSIITFPFRLIFGAGKTVFKIIGFFFRFWYFLMRFLGRNSIAILIGVAIGLLLSRKQVREKISSLLKK
jgi:hypothetical protein